MNMRLNRFLASAGVASRRKCDELIQNGRVAVNGAMEGTPAVQVGENDVVTCDGKRVSIVDHLVYLMFNKPRGYLTTITDPHGRNTVMAFFRDISYRIYPVGRLDSESEGLLLFTNDGTLTYILTHPRFEIEKIYRVTVSGRVDPELLTLLVQGLQQNGQWYRLASAKIIEYHNDMTIVDVTLKEGKKHEVRILFGALDHPVLRLVRMAMGPVLLDPDLLPGQWRYLRDDERRGLQEYSQKHVERNQVPTPLSPLERGNNYLER